MARGPVVLIQNLTIILHVFGQAELWNRRKEWIKEPIKSL